MVDKSVRLNVKRQDTPQSPSHWEEFELRWRPGMNVISALRDIAMNPVDRHGKPTIPITYDSNCLEDVCGSCAMRINGRAAMVCSSLVDSWNSPFVSRTALTISRCTRPVGQPRRAVRESQ